MRKKLYQVFIVTIILILFVSCDLQYIKPPPTSTPSQYDSDYMTQLLNMNTQDFTVSQISGTDGLAREINTRGIKTGGKYVGIFYFLWFEDNWNDVYDISKILNLPSSYSQYDTAKHPLWVANQSSPYYRPYISPTSAFHYYEEPFYGYYNSKDPWVIKRHLELLTYAGIDFLYLDFTNAYFNGNNVMSVYPEQTYALLDGILEMIDLGYNVPK